jgi:hypothetical protein
MHHCHGAHTTVQAIRHLRQVFFLDITPLRAALPLARARASNQPRVDDSMNQSYADHSIVVANVRW